MSRRATTIEQAVRMALGGSADAVSKRRLAGLQREFVAAGRRAISRHGDPVRHAARQATEAKRTLGAARRQLAAATAPGHADVIVDPEWRLFDLALREHRDRLLETPGVVGLGLGYRRRDGQLDESEPCVLVYVSRKYRLPALRKRERRPIPRSLRTSSGRRVRTDVVEFGTLRRQLDGGAGLGPAALNEMGTLGTFAIDFATGLPVALTAMHVTGERECPPQPMMPMVSPSRIEGGARPLGRVISGSMSGIDAAKIAIASSVQATPSIREIGPVRGWRPLVHPGDRGTAVRMFGARTGQMVVGRIVEPSFSLPEYHLDSAILVDIHSQNGDSGAAIVDNEQLVLGLLVGDSSKLKGLRIFTPISSVLARLACNIPTLEER